MRIFIALIIALIAAPALAQDWGQYRNERFGYAVDIPPGFYQQQTSDNGDGASFALGGKANFLVVWGGNLTEDFEAEVAQRMAWAEDEAWNITYQATTPRWASFSAIKGFRILYQRMVLLCDGTSYAAFQSDYPVTESGSMDAVIERLVGSLRGEC